MITSTQQRNDMTEYIVNVYVREVWVVEAETEEEAKQLAKTGQGRLQTTIDTGKITTKQNFGEYA
jgi:GTP1/Obg family GTP-binding protein